MSNYFSINKDNDVDVIQLSFNEISLEEREELKKDLTETIVPGSKCIMDFSKVGFLSSLLIATIVFFAKEKKKKPKC